MTGGREANLLSLPAFVISVSVIALLPQLFDTKRVGCLFVPVTPASGQCSWLFSPSS